MNKTNGPKRIPLVSVGVLRDIPYEPDAVEQYPELRPTLNAQVTFDDLLNEYYVENTILWLIKAVSSLPNVCFSLTFSQGQGPIASTFTTSFKSVYIFAPYEKRWIRKEALFVSETCTEDHYQRRHPKNKGK